MYKITGYLKNVYQLLVSLLFSLVKTTKIYIKGVCLVYNFKDSSKNTLLVLGINGTWNWNKLEFWYLQIKLCSWWREWESNHRWKQIINISEKGLIKINNYYLSKANDQESTIFCSNLQGRTRFALFVHLTDTQCYAAA